MRVRWRSSFCISFSLTTESSRVYMYIYNTWVIDITREKIDTPLDFLHLISALDQPFSSRLRLALKRFTRKARSSRRENDARQIQPLDKAFPSLSSCSSASRFHAAYIFFLFRPLLQSCSSISWTAPLVFSFFSRYLVRYLFSEINIICFYLFNDLFNSYKYMVYIL